MWRIHLFQSEQFLHANPYNAALNYGDGSGAGYEDVARSRQAPGAELAGLAIIAPGAHAALVSELATLDAADSTIIAGTDQTGQLRYNSRRELAAIDALEADALDPSPSQSATEVLDKISRKLSGSASKEPVFIDESEWRRGWDSNAVSSCRICNLQIPHCQDCRGCRRCRGALPDFTRRNVAHHKEKSDRTSFLRSTV
jgi:hypothetical protein